MIFVLSTHASVFKYQDIAGAELFVKPRIVYSQVIVCIIYFYGYFQLCVELYQSMF